MDNNTNESTSYGTMLQEVEGIIEKIGNDKTDLDAMVNQVERGYHLIKCMRDRLKDAKGKIEKLQESFESSLEEGSDA